MSRSFGPQMVGNEFALPQSKLRVIVPVAVTDMGVGQEAIPVRVTTKKHRLQNLVDLAHQHSLIVFAFLILLVGATGVRVAGNYWSARLQQAKAGQDIKVTYHTIAGLSLAVPLNQLDSKINSITHQSASLTVGDKTDAISPDTIRSWLTVTKDNSVAHINIRPKSITTSLNNMANKYVKAPVNAVTATHDGVTSTIASGQDGVKLTDPGTLAAEASKAAATVMDAKGLSFNTPAETQAFSTVTPTAFSKLIEVNVVTKQMYLYDNGNLYKQYPISAGAPATPTPIGQYKVYAKFASQDMKGYNTNGTKYFQPHVHWINYFLPGGYAVHGVYWHPESWFGNINSSHGCVGLPDAQAKEVYDWTPIGTTVITHY